MAARDHAVQGERGRTGPVCDLSDRPFIASAGNSLTFKGSFPTSRFMSFTVYNDSSQDFTNTVEGSSVPSDLSDYQIKPDQGSENP